MLILAVSAFSWAADRPESLPKPSPAFFSGFVDSYETGRITVRRSSLGTKEEFRSFTVTPETRVEGRIRPKSRVTVRFVAYDEEDRVALSILVRDPRRP